MRIWIDVLTPKQVLFFYPLIKKLEKKNHDILITSRKYREAEGMLKLRDLYNQTFIIGKHGGGDKRDKLNASLQCTRLLTKFAVSMQPDLCISFCSPEAAKVTFGLGINHYAYCNASHADKVLRLTLPLVQKLLCPNHIPVKDFTRYGISPENVIQYQALDEFILVRDKTKSNFKPKHFKKPVLLVRDNESQASYNLRKFDTLNMIVLLADKYPQYQFVIIPRYRNEIRYMKNRLGKSAYVYDKVVDSKTVLEQCVMFIGSGGTMTTEAVLRGVPAISLNTAPNADESWLVANGYLQRAETFPQVIKAIEFQKDNKFGAAHHGQQLMNEFEDPHSKLFSLRLIK